MASRLRERIVEAWAPVDWILLVCVVSLVALIAFGFDGVLKGALAGAVGYLVKRASYHSRLARSKDD